MSEDDRGRLNAERAQAAAGLGAVALLFFFFASVVAAFAAFTAVGNLIFGGPPDPGPVAYVGIYVVSPAIAAFGAALPARALGAERGCSLLTAATAVGAFFGMESETLVAVVLALAPAVVTFVGSAGSGISEAGGLTVLAGAAAFLLIALWTFSYGEAVAADYCIVLPAWVVLPAIAGLFQPRRDEEESSL